jgi:thiamine biosynthesis lipoprotein
MKGTVGAVTMALVAVIATAPTWALGAGAHTVRYLMGTWCDLVILDPQPGPEVAESVFQEIARLEHVLSSWDTSSEVSRLNANAGHGPQTVSDDLVNVVEESRSICGTTGGAFDATVAPLLRAWGFLSDSPATPDPDVSRDAESHVGCDRVTVQHDSKSVALADGSSLDFGGIGKGYAVDRALAILRARGVTRAKVDFGSSSLGFLGRIDGGWPVVIVDPLDRETPLVSFRVTGGSVSTSSQQERYFVSDGHRYGHIFDPRVGRPVESRLLSVTVIMERGSSADALSTGLFVMGATEGKRLISQMPDVSAVFVEQGENGLAISTAGKLTGLSRLSH